jgi:glycosyltransferase involved in cell wall biosynthesis
VSGPVSRILILGGHPCSSEVAPNGPLEPGARICLRLTARRKILFVTPFPPRLDAHHGGGRSVAQLISRLAAHHRIALLTLRAEHEQPVDERLRDRCEFVEEVPRPLIGRSPRRAWTERRRLLMLLTGNPDWLAGVCVAGFANRLSEIAHSWVPDVVQVEFLVMAQYLRGLDGCRAARVLVDLDPPLRSPQTVRARIAWRKLLTAGAQEADAVVVLTNSDRELVRSLTRAGRIVRIPLAIEFPERALDPIGSRSSPTVLFFGSFTHRPNVDAALRLVRRILPRVLERSPRARLSIVGADPPRSVRRAAGENVAVMGAVPDLAPYLDQAAVVVAPISTGGGMRVKVLETLAAGKALVASQLAVDGLDLTTGAQVALASTDAEFAERIVELLDDPVRRASMAHEARRWARINLGWEGPVSEYDALYESLTGGS